MWLAASSIISFETKPLNRGMPAMASEAVTASAAVIGISRLSPPSREMLRVPVSWSTMPALMKSAALNVAWLRMCRTAATAAILVPKPRSIVIRPRWLTVE